MFCRNTRKLLFHYCIGASDLYKLHDGIDPNVTINCSDLSFYSNKYKYISLSKLHYIIHYIIHTNHRPNYNFHTTNAWTCKWTKNIQPSVAKRRLVWGKSGFRKVTHHLLHGRFVPLTTGDATTQNLTC